MAMLRALSRTSGLILLILLFCGLLVFLIWNQLLVQLATDRRDSIAAAIQRSDNLAVSLEQYAIRTIRNADAVLQLVKMEYETKGQVSNFDTLFHKGVIDLNYFHSVAIADEKGCLRHSNLELKNDAPLNIADRAYFRFHQAHRDSLYISGPLLSKTIGKAVIVISRRLERPDGSFGGVIAVQIEPATFTQFYSEANLGRHDLISLIAPDGTTYARRTGRVESYGENIRRSPLFAHVARKPVHHYYARDAIRGIPSYFSYRKLADYPVIATVGTAEADVLAGYRARARRDYMFGSILTVLLVLFSLLISNVLLQRKKITRKVRISENRYRSVFEHSQDAIVVLGPNGQIDAMNGAACRQFGTSREGGPARSFRALFEKVEPAIDFTGEGASGKAEVVFARTDGSRFEAEIVYSTYRDYRGSSRFVVLIRDISLQKEMEQRLVREQKRYQRELTKQIILAQEREREAIGHELHDNVNQILTTIKLYLEMATHHPAMRDELLPKSTHHIRDCISEIRNLSHELSAPTLGTQSLIDSVKALVEMVASATGLCIRLVHDQYHTALAKDQRLAIYRILQEQLNNISKHAAATEVEIVLAQQEGTTHLRISDNGRGFDTGQKRNGIGLNNILSRAKVFGGEMLLDSREGRGTVLKVLLPIQSSEAADEPV